MSNKFRFIIFKQGLVRMKIAKLISKFDLFSANATLRASGEAEVGNFCGGFFSILVFAAFLTVFAISLNNTVSLQKISTTEMSEMKSPQVDPIGNITIGVGLQFINLSMFRNIFEFRAFTIDNSMQYRQISVFPCQRQDWKEFNDQKYKTLRLQTHLCLQKENVSIYGENGAANFNLLFFNLSLCNNATSAITCASPQQMETFFNMFMIQGKYMACSIVFLDTGINPTSKDPLSHTSYQKTLWLLFNYKQQIMIQTYLGRYEITTDTNFFPFETIQTLKGYFVDESVVTTVMNIKNQPLFIDSYLFASPVNRIINRQYGKIDEVLSYVGGLYGVIISFLAFFLLSFNQYRYELRVSEGAFSQQSSDPVFQKDLHFGKYLKYVAFDWIRNLLCCQPNWSDCKSIDQARDQANEQVDVKHLLRRISHLQNIVSLVSTQHISKSIFMIKSPSIESVKSRRNFMEYCEQFQRSIVKSMTIVDFQQIEANESSILMGQQNMGSKLNSSITSNSKILVDFEKTQINIDSQKVDNKNSLQLMKEYVEKYTNKYNIRNELLQMSENHLIAESQLAQSFFSLKEEDRLKIIRKIPLGILFRMKERLNKKQDTKTIQYEYKQQNKDNFLSQTSIAFENKQKIRRNGRIKPNFIKTLKPLDK